MGICGEGREAGRCVTVLCGGSSSLSGSLSIFDDVVLNGPSIVLFPILMPFRACQFKPVIANIPFQAYHSTHIPKQTHHSKSSNTQAPAPGFEAKSPSLVFSSLNPCFT